MNTRKILDWLVRTWFVFGKEWEGGFIYLFFWGGVGLFEGERGVVGWGVGESEMVLRIQTAMEVIRRIIWELVEWKGVYKEAVNHGLGHPNICYSRQGPVDLAGYKAEEQPSRIGKSFLVDAASICLVVGFYLWVMISF